MELSAVTYRTLHSGIISAFATFKILHINITYAFSHFRELLLFRSLFDNAITGKWPLFFSPMIKQKAARTKFTDYTTCVFSLITQFKHIFFYLVKLNFLYLTQCLDRYSYSVLMFFFVVYFDVILLLKQWYNIELTYGNLF